MKIIELEPGRRYLVETSLTMDKQFFLGLQFVMLAMSKDDSRPALMSLQIKDGKMYAADGFRIHKMDFTDHDLNITSEIGLPEGLFKVMMLGKGCFILEQEDEKFPNCEEIIADGEKLWKEVSNDPDKKGSMKIAFDPYFLGEFGKIRKLIGAQSPVRFRFVFDNTPALFDAQADNLKFTGILMPMHL